LKSILWKVIPVVIACIAAGTTVFTASAQGQQLPPLPVVYSGRVSIEGQPTPEGLRIYARILEYKTKRTAPVTGGQYFALTVAPVGAGYVGKRIYFYATWCEEGREGCDVVQAVEAATYRVPTFGDLTRVQNLFFLRLPAPPPTPTPAPTPTMTPTPTPALPIPGDPAVGTIWVWVTVAGVLGLVGGLAALGLARAR